MIQSMLECAGAALRLHARLGAHGRGARSRSEDLADALELVAVLGGFFGVRNQDVGNGLLPDVAEERREEIWASVLVDQRQAAVALLEAVELGSICRKPESFVAMSLVG